MRPWLAALVATALIAGVGAWGLHRAEWDQPEEPRAQAEALRISEEGVVSYRASTHGACIREPQNTWTNLAYVFVGVWIAVGATVLRERLLGWAMVFLGIGSGVYHASLMPAWRLLDVMGMYWVTFALLACLATAHRALARIGEWSLVLVLALGAFVAAIHRNEVRIAGVKIFDSTYVTVAGFVVAGLFLSLGAIKAFRTGCSFAAFTAVSALFSAGLAAVCQLGDRVGSFLSAPDAPVQGHAMWHIFSAVAMGLA